MKYKGRLLNLDIVDLCGIKFPKDCKITFLEVVPVLYNFERGPSSQCLGSAKIYKDDKGLNCEISFINNDFVDEEYSVGGFYNKVKSHDEGNHRIIDECNLIGVSILPGPACAAYNNLKVKREE